MLETNIQQFINAARAYFFGIVPAQQQAPALSLQSCR